MISFRNRFAVVAAALMLVAAPALAQGTAETAPNAPPAAAGSDGFVSPFKPIESQSLGDVGANTVGVLDEGSGGFRPDMWASTNRLIVETLLPKVPAVLSSPTMNDLARRLVLSRAEAPVGATRGASLLGLRLERALEIGQVGAVEAMAQQSPAEAETPGVAGVRVDAMLYAGQTEDACSLAERMRGRASDAAWTKRLAFCSALAGKVADARLGTDLLAETGVTDEGFAALMAKMVDKAKTKSVAIAAPGAVHFAMLLKTATALDDASLAGASPAFLTAWSAYEKAPLNQRIAAAELSTASGVLPIASLLSLYGEVKFKPETLAAPFDPKTMPKGVEGAAYAVQRVPMTDDSVERGKVIAAAIDAARLRGAFPAVAASLRAALTSLEPSPALASMAATLGNGEVIAGGGSHARRWYDLQVANGKGTSEEARALRTLVGVRGDIPDLSWSAEDFLARANGAGPSAKSRVVLEWSLLRALGATQTESIYIATLQGPTTINKPAASGPVLEGLRSAAFRDRLGETVLYALVALGKDGPRGAHPATIAAVVGALDDVGLNSEARSVATEALAWQMP